MKIPPETSSGRTFRLPGYGMPQLKGGGAGDQLVRVQIVIPTGLSPRENELYEELKKLTSGEPRTMRLDKLTVKAQEAIQAAQSLADQGSHQAIEPEHLLLALLQQQEGVVGPLLAKLGARPEALARQVAGRAGKLPKVRGGGGRSTPRRALRGRAQPRAGRGGAAQGRVRLDRAPADRHRPGEGRRRRADPGRGRRHPGGDLPGAGGGARHPARHRPQPRGEVPGAAALLQGPDRAWPARASSTRSSAATRRSAA